jgi:hypothetical protein
MSVARSSTPSEVAATWTPANAWTALRVDATRDTDWSWASSSALDVESFTMETSREIQESSVLLMCGQVRR